MSYEERAVFPYVRNLLEGKRDPKYNITIFRKRHDQIEMKITELKNILIKYYPGAGTNMLNSVLFDIFATEEDLASHTRVEDYLFVPAILAGEPVETVTGFPYPDGGDSFGGISFRLASYAQTGCVDRESGFARLFHVAAFEGGKRLCRDEMYRFIIFCLRQCVIAFL